ncbi:MAG: hypothetical protein ACHQU1_05935 [Gemmatimonadales bacterium]
MRAGMTVALLALGLRPVPGAAQGSSARTAAADLPAERMSWVSCRAIAPATLQLIWHGVPPASGYTVTVARIGTFTTGDTTYTRGSMPDGPVEVSVSYYVRMRDWPRAGDSAVVYPARRGAAGEVLTGLVTFPVPSGQTHSCR